MADATSAGMITVRIEINSYIILWIILTTILFCEMSCLWYAGLRSDFRSALIFIEPIVLFLLMAWIFWLIGQAFYNLRIIQHAALTLQDFLFSMAQLMTLLAISGLTIYLAAYAGTVFPMRDDSLEYFDSLLGYDWRAVSHWLYNHPTLDGILLQAYDSLDLQIVLIIAFTSITYPGKRNCEFLALFLVSVVVTAMIFIFVPVFGMFGKADTETFDRLLDIRAGGSIMTYNCTASIINFPSYHTVLAILIPYSARHRCWSLIPTFLLNVVMLAATSPEGGHYLVDMLAGAVVAAVSILVVRRWLPCYEARQDHNRRVTRFERHIKIGGELPSMPSGKRIWVR